MNENTPRIPWVRLNAATNQDARLIRAGFWATAAWPQIIAMAKAHGWRGGRIPKDELDATLLAHHMNGSVTDCTVTQGLTQGIEALVRVELLSLDGAYYVIRSWAKYQSDPSNAERQSRHRERKPSKEGVTVLPVMSQSNGDVTGRDVTGESSPLPPPLSREGDPASPPNGERLRPREVRAAAAAERLRRAEAPEHLAQIAARLPIGVAMHGGYVPGTAVTGGAANPSTKAREIRSFLDPPPATPISGASIDSAELERRKTEALRRLNAQGGAS